MIYSQTFNIFKFFIMTSVDANVLYGLHFLKLLNACLLDSTTKVSENDTEEGTISVSENITLWYYSLFSSQGII